MTARTADLRAQMREWRRGRSEVTLGQVVSDAYVAIFCTLMIAAMGISVLATLRDLTATQCTEECADSRSMVPFVAVVAAIAATLAVARLLGPVFVPPAAGHWLLGSPTPRAAWLRGPLLRAVTVGLVGSALVLCAPLVIASADLPAAAWLGACGVLACGAAVTWAAAAQVRESGLLRRAGAVGGAAMWVLLCLTAFRPDLLGHDRPATVLLLGLTAAAGLLFLAGLVLAWRSLAATERRALDATGQAWPILSGALASMDTTMLFDVLQSRYWRARGWVVSRRGGPRGWWALARRDLARARRRPGPWVAVLAAWLVPFAAVGAGYPAVAAMLTALVGFLLGPSVATGLRTVARTPTLARLYPFEVWQVRAAHLLAPALAMTLLGVATAAAVAPDLGGARAALLGLAVAASGLASTSRWLCSTPPDYGGPMLSTPAGGLPPGMVMALVKGFDIWLLTAIPLLLESGGWWVSVAISAGVLVRMMTNGASTPGPATQD